MASNPATATDLSTRSLRALTPTELSVGTTLLEDAFNRIVVRVPTVPARMDGPPVDAGFTALVVQIQCAMVLRVLNNPDGKLQESGDDYSYRLDAAVSTGALYLSGAEADLLGSGDNSSAGAWTIRPGAVGIGPGYWSGPDTWVPLP